VTYRVYIIQNRDGKFYIGVSDDLHRRVAQHNASESKWTRGKGPLSLVWQSAEMNLSDARKLELLLKRQKGGEGFTECEPAIPQTRDYEPDELPGCSTPRRYYGDRGDESNPKCFRQTDFRLEMVARAVATQKFVRYFDDFSELWSYNPVIAHYDTVFRFARAAR
jgi:putative endonuclease